MIIKFIPETEAEKAKHKEIKYTGVKEFLVFGNRKDADGYLVDFHEWEGGYRYLLGSLDFFYNEINDERKGEASNRIVMQSAPTQPRMIKHGDVQPLEIIEPEVENVADIPDDADNGANKDEKVDEAFPEDEAENSKTLQFPPQGTVHQIPKGKITQFNAKDIESFIKDANKKYGKGQNDPTE